MELELFTACCHGNLDRVRELLPLGVNPSIIPNGKCTTSLHIAVMYGYLEIVKELIPLSDLNAVDYKGDSLLHVCCIFTNLEIIRMLLYGSSKIDVNIRNKEGQTPLHIGVFENELEFVKELLSAPSGGADPNIVDNLNGTPLYWAAVNGGSKIVKELLMNGADPSILPTEDTDLNYAYNDEVSKLLKHHFPSLQQLSVNLIRKHKIDIRNIPKELFSTT